MFVCWKSNDFYKHRKGTSRNKRNFKKILCLLDKFLQQIAFNFWFVILMYLIQSQSCLHNDQNKCWKTQTKSKVFFNYTEKIFPEFPSLNCCAIFFLYLVQNIFLFNVFWFNFRWFSFLVLCYLFICFGFVVIWVLDSNSLEFNLFKLKWL